MVINILISLIIRYFSNKSDTRCGPCHAIAPKFESLSKQYPNVNFFKCNVDTAKDVASKYRVSAMPTFIFIRSNTILETVRGANPAGIENAIKKYSSGHDWGKGQTLSNNSSTSSNNDSNYNNQLYIGIALLGIYVALWYYNF